MQNHPSPPEGPRFFTSPLLHTSKDRATIYTLHTSRRTRTKPQFRQKTKMLTPPPRNNITTNLYILNHGGGSGGGCGRCGLVCVYGHHCNAPQHLCADPSHTGAHLESLPPRPLSTCPVASLRLPLVSIFLYN